MWGEEDTHLKPRPHTSHLDSESGSVALLSKDQCTLWTFPGVTVAASVPRRVLNKAASAQHQVTSCGLPASQPQNSCPVTVRHLITGSC